MTDPDETDARLDTVRQLAEAAGAEAAVVSHAADIRWAVGFTGSNGLLVVTETAAHLVTDGRYREQASCEVAGAEVWVAPGPLAETVAERGLLDGAARAAVQADHVTVADLGRLKEALPDVRFEPVSAFLAAAVAAKTPSEVEAVRRAQALTCGVFEAVLPYVQPGVSELDLAAEVTYQHLKRGASAMSFPPIVASGARGALPHARPSSKTLRPGELVVLDMGGVLDGWCSDLTRTVAVGEPPDAAREAYAVVQRAQRRPSARRGPASSGATSTAWPAT